MRIKLLAVGTKMPRWVEEGVEEYRKRLSQEIVLDIQEIPMAKRGKNADIKKLRQQETDALLKAVPKGHRIIALDVKGRSISTESLAESLSQWQMEGTHVCLLVGGPDGIDPAGLRQADERWSLSALTLPHPLVRVLLSEQIYRASTILQGHPYHR